jgi:transposase
MTPEKLFHPMLGLGNEWQVTDCRFDEGNGVFLEIKEAPGLWARLRCPNDNAEVFCYDHTEVMEWRHLNVFEHHCHIRARLPRAKCRRCELIHRVRPPWEGLSKHFTQAFEAYVLLLAREMPVRRVSQMVEESDTRLWRLIDTHVKTARAADDQSMVTCVGVDEMNLRKGRQYLTVFADLEKGRVLFGVEGKDAGVWARFVEDLGAHNGHPHAITHVSMDMSPAYQNGVAEYCRNARVVFDKYHVIANVNAAVDQARKMESSWGTDPARHDLQKSLWLWRKNPQNLGPEQRERLERLRSRRLWTAKAYQMRLALQEIYNEPHEGKARRRLLAWCRWVRYIGRRAPAMIFKAMFTRARMILRHFEGILAHWQHGLTNAYMEGLNSVFSATKRKARGYRTTNYLLTMLYLVAAKLKIPAQPPSPLFHRK